MIRFLIVTTVTIAFCLTFRLVKSLVVLAVVWSHIAKTLLRRATLTPRTGRRSTRTSRPYVSLQSSLLMLFALAFNTPIVSFSQSINITLYDLPLHAGAPDDITAGPDGAMWFTECRINKIGRIAPAGAITEYPLPNGGIYSGSCPLNITNGSDGALWFIENGNTSSHQIGRISTGGNITEYTVPNTECPFCQVGGIAAGPDGALWFTVASANQIGRITTTGQFTMYNLGPAYGGRPDPGSIALGSDGEIGRAHV